MSQKKILIVEDNENNRNLLNDILVFHGYDVTLAANGEEGLSLAAKLKPDLILMDIQMPGMDGVTACGILKGPTGNRDLKIIALTSFAMQGDREKFLAAGFDDYLAKPVNTRSLPGQIEQWLAGKYQP